jgi:hypothetical protein
MAEFDPPHLHVQNQTDHRSRDHAAPSRQSVARTLTLVMVLSLCHVTSSIAQIIANPIVGGVPVNCAAVTGQPVLTMVQFLATEPARSAIISGTPVIILSNRFYEWPRAVQLFVYAHECVHHRMGYVGTSSPNLESQVDCQAIRLLKAQALVDRMAVLTIGDFLSSPLSATLFSQFGPQRTFAILKCFDE